MFGQIRAMWSTRRASNAPSAYVGRPARWVLPSVPGYRGCSCRRHSDGCRFGTRDSSRLFSDSAGHDSGETYRLLGDPRYGTLGRPRSQRLDRLLAFGFPCEWPGGHERIPWEAARQRARCVGRTSSAPPSIPPPRPIALLHVETQRLAPLGAGDCRWTHRPTPHTGRPGGPNHRPNPRPAPEPSPIVGTAPRPPRCIGSSGSTWRPTSPWPTRPIPWATVCRITWKRSLGAI